MEPLSLNDQGLYDIYPIMTVPFWERSRFLVIVGAVVLFFIASFVFLLVRRFMKKRALVPAWKVALSKLSTLTLNDSLSDQQARDAYALMTAVIKEYIEKRFSIGLCHLTDHEAIEILNRADFEGNSIEPFVPLFQAASAIKFAHERVTAAHLIKDVDQIRSFIYATRVMPSPSKIK